MKNNRALIYVTINSRMKIMILFKKNKNKSHYLIVNLYRINNYYLNLKNNSNKKRLNNLNRCFHKVNYKNLNYLKNLVLNPNPNHNLKLNLNNHRRDKFKDLILIKA